GSLVCQKPLLTLNAGDYAKWNANASVAASNTEEVSADNGLRPHPIFKDITLGDAEDGFALPKILSGAEDSILQAIAVPESATSYVLGGAEGKVCFFEDFTTPKYKVVYLGIKPAQAKFVNSTANKLIAQTLKYLSTGGAFAAPTFEIDKDGNAIVENVTELRAALVYDFSPLNLSQSTILLKEGEYVIDGAEFGSGTFVLQPYQNGNVLLRGNMTPTQKVDVKSITFKNMTLESSASQPFLGLNVEKSNLSLYVDNCTITAPAPLLAADADSVKMTTVSVKNSRLNNISSLVYLADKPVAAAKVTMSENVVDGMTGDFIKWGPVYPDGEKAIVIEMSHNTVIAANPIANMINMAGVVAYDSVRVVLSDNLFYNALKEKGFTIASDSLIRFKTENNLFYNSAFEPLLKADSLRVSNEDLTMEGLGLTSIFESDDVKTISKMSPLFTAGTSRSYVGALASYSDRTEPMVIKVHNTQEFTDAMNIAIGGDVIEFCDQVPANDTDTLKYGEYGVYYLGTTGFPYPTTGGDLTLRAGEGQHPILFGRLAPNNAAKLDALRIVGLKFADQEDYPNYDKDAAGPFYFSTAAKIGVFHVTQCTFENLQNQQVMRANNCAGMNLGEVRFDYNVFENHGGTMADGNVGAAHFFQFANGADYTLDHFTFVENIVSNFHGSQLFNISRSGSKGDSAIVINISNNLFYKLGGNAKDQNRNFLEFNKAPQGCTVDILVANNLFYKRWSDVNKPICQVALYDTEGVVSSNIVITNNYFEGEYYPADGETYGANPVSNSTAEDAVLYNLAQTGGEVEVTRGEPLTWEVLGVDEVFTDEAALTISQSSPLYTAGLNGACIGPKICYGIKEALNSAEMANEGLQAFSRDGRVYVNAARSTELRIYSLTGKMVRSQMLTEGVNEVDGLAAGLYIVRVNNAAVKVLVR
ncbi:MAG: T9SS type A sorting domain-containing protein, partial [Bacteroidales bacterium]|nr:T9SS type A sorting domain-containing protein [Bacteroidales bacterium]